MKDTAAKGNTDKLKELILYIATQTEADDTVGKLKFNKLLFFADFVAYGKLGKPITGSEYVRLHKGPAPRYVDKAIDALVESKEAARATRTNAFGYECHRIVALRDANVNLFSGPELDVVVRVLNAAQGMSGEALSRESHQFLGWQIAKDNETIPYGTVFLSNRGLTKKEADYALELTASSVAS